MRSFVRVAALAVAATLPVIGLTSGSAVAKKPKPAAIPQILVTASPNPVVETSTSDVTVIIQVEANAADAGKTVTISSTQLAARCASASYDTLFGAATIAGVALVKNSISTVLDNDGNTTVDFFGTQCAPGPMLITADVDSPPFSTAVTKLIVSPPQVTVPGVHGFPNPEVEVGDGGTGMGTLGESDAYVAFDVETNPVFAEQTATITSDQLTERCILGSRWFAADGTAPGVVVGGGTASNPGPVAGVVVSGVIDNDGNVDFKFFGASCAAGKSTVIAEILAGGPTYSSQWVILPPAVTV